MRERPDQGGDISLTTLILWAAFIIGAAVIAGALGPIVIAHVNDI
ncbi:hypothetical protein [Streptomyces aureoverticillatus]|nr:hypothetical protein [Streptomyces aureoverticillatus]